MDSDVQLRRNGTEEADPGFREAEHDPSTFLRPIQPRHRGKDGGSDAGASKVTTELN